MKICIVGHAPSLLSAGLGKKIDGHDVVVRLKQGWKQCLTNPEDYGKKISILMTSTETFGCFEHSQLIKFEPFGLNRYWAYPKYGWYEEHRLSAIERHIGARIEIPLNWINRLNWKFRQDAGHPNVSLGMAAILYVKHYFETPEIILAGFDTLLNPDLAFDRNPNIPRTGTGPYPDHDWKRENELLQSLRLNVRAI